MEYQPEDTQVSTAGDTYVPSLEVLYLGARGRYDGFFSKKTERIENKCAMTSHKRQIGQIHNYLLLNVLLQMFTDVTADALHVQQKNDNFNRATEYLTRPET